MDPIKGFEHARFVKASEAVLAKILGTFGVLPKMEGRLGASFCASDEDGIPVATLRCGEVPLAKRARYKHFSEEKGMRLALLHKYAGHKTSRESVDEDLEFYTGGIRGDSMGFQISGFPADIDEIGSILLGFVMNHVDHGTALSMAAANPHREILPKLLEWGRSAFDD